MISHSFDTALVAPARDAELTADVRALYDEHAPALIRTLRRLTGPGTDVMDLLHDVFVIALKRATALSAATSRKAWLFGIALKVASEARRRAKFRRFFGLDVAASIDTGRTPDSELSRAQSIAQVQLALGRLSDTKREVLVLFEFEGMSGQDIALAMGCPVATVWTRLHHARRALEQELGAQERP